MAAGGTTCPADELPLASLFIRAACAQILILENVRFHPEETKNDSEFSKQVLRCAAMTVCHDLPLLWLSCSQNASFSCAVESATNLQPQASQGR